MTSKHSPHSALSEAEASAIIAMAWQDDTPFEAIAQQFGLQEPEVIALMRTALKARWYFPVLPALLVTNAVTSQLPFS